MHFSSSLSLYALIFFILNVVKQKKFSSLLNIMCLFKFQIEQKKKQEKRNFNYECSVESIITEKIMIVDQ